MLECSETKSSSSFIQQISRKKAEARKAWDKVCFENLLSEVNSVRFKNDLIAEFGSPEKPRTAFRKTKPVVQHWVDTGQIPYLSSMHESKSDSGSDLDKTNESTKSISSESRFEIPSKISNSFHKNSDLPSESVMPATESESLFEFPSKISNSFHKNSDLPSESMMSKKEAESTTFYKRKLFSCRDSCTDLSFEVEKRPRRVMCLNNFYSFLSSPAAPKVLESRCNSFSLNAAVKNQVKESRKSLSKNSDDCNDFGSSQRRNGLTKNAENHKTCELKSNGDCNSNKPELTTSPPATVIYCPSLSDSSELSTIYIEKESKSESGSNPKEKVCKKSKEKAIVQEKPAKRKRSESSKKEEKAEKPRTDQQLQDKEEKKKDEEKTAEQPFAKPRNLDPVVCTRISIRNSIDHRNNNSFTDFWKKAIARSERKRLRTPQINGSTPPISQAPSTNGNLLNYSINLVPVSSDSSDDDEKPLASRIKRKSVVSRRKKSNFSKSKKSSVSSSKRKSKVANFQDLKPSGILKTVPVESAKTSQEVEFSSDDSNLFSPVHKKRKSSMKIQSSSSSEEDTDFD